MKVITPSVALQHHTPQAMIATAARASYQSYDNQKLTDERLISHFVAENESPLEFAWAMVSVTCSYAAHIHFLRHRHMSQSWLSQRYTEGLGFVVPEALTPNGHILDTYRYAEGDYQRQRSGGAKKQDARYVLPQGTAIQGWMAGNARAWLNLLALRTSKKAMPEVRHVAQLIEAELRAVWPLLLPEAE